MCVTVIRFGSSQGQRSPNPARGDPQHKKMDKYRNPHEVLAALTEPREGRSCAAALSVGVPLLCTPGGGHCITTSMGQELRSPQSMVSMKKPFGASTRAWVCFGLPHCKPRGAAPQIPQPLTSPVGGDDRWVDSMISSNLSDSVVLAASTRWNGAMALCEGCVGAPTSLGCFSASSSDLLLLL